MPQSPLHHSTSPLSQEKQKFMGTLWTPRSLLGQQSRPWGHGWGKERVSRKPCMKGRLAFLDRKGQWGPQ